MKKVLDIDQSTDGSENVANSFTPSRDDSIVWNAFRSGDEKALVVIFDRYAKALFNYGKKIVADSHTVKDAIQDLFLELWKNRESLGETDSIKFYLFKSLRRKLVRLKQRSARSIFRNLTGEHDVEISHAYEFVLIAEQMVLEKKQRLMHAFDKLTKRQREAIFLRYFNSLNYDQVADIMNLSRRRVYNLIHEAIQQLRNYLSLAGFVALQLFDL